MSNVRVAPIQVTTYGHPVSTFGGEIDYFIGSETIEAPQLVDRLYSERPVLLPGLCVVHNAPPFAALPAPRPRVDRVYVNCSWFSQKVNYELVEALRRIRQRVRSNVVFRFFPGGSVSNNNHFLPFMRSLEQALGQRSIQLLPQADYVGYMGYLQQGSLALDSFHFGGSNVVVDNLHVRRPILCLEGTRWYNRIGPALLRQVGLEELVATTVDEYVDKAVRLIDDADYRVELIETLKALDLDDLLYHKREVSHFKAAIDYLMANHEELQAEQTREPILVRHILASGSHHPPMA
jgi:predicted O-linked N-acetylglucosamine transferase (SPINDLY family)